MTTQKSRYYHQQYTRLKYSRHSVGSELILPLKCKYCQQRFNREMWPRYLSHIKHHELRYVPYFYGKRKIKQGSPHHNDDINNNVFTMMSQTVFGTPKIPLKSLMKLKTESGDTSIVSRESKEMEQKNFWLGYNSGDFINIPLTRSQSRLLDMVEGGKELKTQEGTKGKRKRFRSYREKLSKNIKVSFSKKATKKDAENPYNVCLYCKKVFPKASSRKLHELIHTGLRPLQVQYLR